jgi:hypothetical protein
MRRLRDLIWQWTDSETWRGNLTLLVLFVAAMTSLLWVIRSLALPE